MKSSYLWTFVPHLRWENRIRTVHSFLAREKCFNAQITYCLLILSCQSHKSVKQPDFLRQKLKRCSNENILETIILAWWAAHMVALFWLSMEISPRDISGITINVSCVSLPFMTDMRWDGQYSHSWAPLHKVLLYMITKTAQVDFLIDRAAFLLCVIVYSYFSFAFTPSTASSNTRSGS